MAGGRIKGITIEIGGDTTKLQTALKQVNSQISQTQSNLKDINKLLKFDPGNAELLAQKQKNLSEAITATEEKLKKEKEALEQLENASNSSETVKEQEALKREIIDTENSLKSLNKEMKNFGSVGAQQIAAVGDKMKAVGDKMKSIGQSMTKYVTGPIIAMGTASITAFNEVDEGMDNIAKKTGATGDALEEMEGILKDITTSIPTDFATAGNAIGEVNTRFGVTGDKLEELSSKFIKFATLNDTDVSSSIDSVQKALSNYGLTADDAGQLLDRLNAVGQQTGVSVETLTEGLISNAAAFQELGMSIDESVVFMGMMEKSGANAETVMQGLRKALKNAANDGVPLKDALSDLQDTILNGTGSMDGLTAAYDLFGRSGDQIYAAVKEGTLNFEDFAAVLDDVSGSVEQTFEGTLDPIDQMKVLFNELKILGAEIAVPLMEMLLPVMEDLKDIVGQLSEAWRGLSDEQKENVIKGLEVLAVLGPILTMLGSLISTIGSIMTMAPAISGALSGIPAALSGIGTGLSGAFAAAGTAISGVASGLAGVIAVAGPIIAAISLVIAAIVVWVKNWDAIKEAAKVFCEEVVYKIEDLKNQLTANFTLIKTVAEFVWNNIKTSVTNAVDNLKSAVINGFNTLRQNVTSAMNTIKSTVTSIWTAIKTVVTSAMNAVKTNVSSAWSAISGAISSVLGTIRSGVVSTMQNMVAGVQSAVGNVAAAVSGIGTTIHNAISGAIAGALSWGADICKNIAQGIRNGIGQIKSAAAEAAKAIGDRLHFSEPDVGPLSDFHTYMPDMIDLMVKGINDNKNKLALAAEGLAETLVPSTPSSISATYETSGAVSGTLDTVVGLLSQYLPQMADSDVVLSTGQLVGALTPAFNRSLGNRL